MGFSRACVESVGSRVVTGEVCAARVGDVGGIELAVDPGERRRLGWTSPMLAMKASESTRCPAAFSELRAPSSVIEFTLVL